MGTQKTLNRGNGPKFLSTQLEITLQRHRNKTIMVPDTKTDMWMNGIKWRPQKKKKPMQLQLLARSPKHALRKTTYVAGKT